MLELNIKNNFKKLLPRMPRIRAAVKVLKAKEDYFEESKI